MYYFISTVVSLWMYRFISTSCYFIKKIWWAKFWKFLCPILERFILKILRPVGKRTSWKQKYQQNFFFKKNSLCLILMTNFRAIFSKIVSKWFYFHFSLRFSKKIEFKKKIWKIRGPYLWFLKILEHFFSWTKKVIKKPYERSWNSMLNKNLKKFWKISKTEEVI